MSFPFSLASLSVEDKIKLANELTIFPGAEKKEGGEGEDGKKFFRKASKKMEMIMERSVQPPFKFLSASIEKDEIRIPLFYALKEFGKESVCEGTHWKKMIAFSQGGENNTI